MNKYFKIFEIHYTEIETFSGYSDGYGKEHQRIAQFREPTKFSLNWNFDTLEEAETAILEQGIEGREYIIKTIYFKSY